MIAEFVAWAAGLMRRHAYLLVWLALVTHALLDAMTIYGTQLLWPLSEEAFGVGSVFIIDPLYTLPLLILAALGHSDTTSPSQLSPTRLPGARACRAGYLAWSAVGQQIAGQRGLAALVEARIAPERLLATPTPFNTLFWRVIAIDGDRYFNLYVPIFGQAQAVEPYVHRAARPCRPMRRCTLPTVTRLETFADDFVKIITRVTACWWFPTCAWESRPTMYSILR